ncbi:hypothetical protein SAMN05443246_5899 [Paenibacillus sp. GP183]|nr:hypothetical protein SAMN05443246_5899 [Paenibacillus sp. GP183]
MNFFAELLLNRNNFNRKSKIIMREVDCWQGRADIVEAAVENIRPCFTEHQLQLMSHYTCSYLISLLHHNSVRTREYLHNNSGVSIKTTDKWIQELRLANIFTELSTDRFVLGTSFLLPDIYFVAYEVKLHNWKRALYQAIQYKGFSNESYVVMPQNNISPAINNIEAFKANNIGLIEVNNGGTYRVKLKPRSSRPRSKSYNIVGKGMAIRTFCSETITQKHLDEIQ